MGQLRLSPQTYTPFYSLSVFLSPRFRIVPLSPSLIHVEFNRLSPFSRAMACLADRKSVV